MNTGISCLYRDAGNYRKHNEVVVPGTFTLGQTGAITGCPDAGGILYQPGPVFRKKDLEASRKTATAGSNRTGMDLKKPTQGQTLV